MKKDIFGFAVSALVILLFAANSFAQCGGIGFETSTLGTFPNAFVYRTALDFNGDGLTDFAGNTDTASQPTNNIGILLNNGAGGLTPLTLTASNGTFGAFFGGRWADFNADGKPDFLAYYASAPDKVIFFNNGNNGLTFGNALNFATASEYIWTSGDVNADGREDFITRGPLAAGTDEPTFYLYLSDGNGTYAPAIHLAQEHAGLFIGDFNGDGHEDVLDSGRASNATFGYTALFGNGAGNFRVFSKNAPLNDQNVNIVGNTLDFTSDGKDDIVRFTSNIGANTTTVDLLKSVCLQTGQTKIIDFDGDGKSDHAFWNPSNGKWTAKFSSAPNGQPQTSFFGSGNLGDIPAVGDYDGDGKSDTAVFRPSVGDWYILRSSDNSFAGVHFGANGDTPTAADFDGDGKTDIAVFRESAGDWYILQSQSGQFRALHFGTNGDKPVQSDYDRDSRADIAVFRPSNGTWYYLKSSNNQFTAFTWGISGDKPVPADYDGDGKSDIAVYRPNEGNWYVFQSSTNSFSSTHWGANGDIPLSMDTDGNGKSEFTVYRPTGNFWFTFPTSATQFGSGDDVPLSIN